MGLHLQFPPGKWTIEKQMQNLFTPGSIFKAVLNVLHEKVGKMKVDTTFC